MEKKCSPECFADCMGRLCSSQGPSLTEAIKFQRILEDRKKLSEINEAFNSASNNN